jgi:RNA polymerase sigma-70 factor (ECF subfamily)
MIGAADVNEQLTEAALAGDQDALGRLLASHQQLAYSVAFRLLGSDADAADAVQEAFLLAVRAMRGDDARPRDAQHFGPWFVRIVTNVALQRLRRRPRLSPLSVDELVDQLPAQGRDEPSEEVERREIRGDVLRALLALPDMQRAVLTLREYEDLSYEEIAESLGTSRMAVQMLLFRARRNFRAAYEGVAARSRLIGCPELAPLLSSLLDREIAPRSWPALTLHLAHCSHCRNELAELRKARRLSAAIPLLPLPVRWSWPGGTEGAAQAAAFAPSAPAFTQSILHLSGLAATAMAVVAVGLGVTIATSQPPGPEEAGADVAHPRIIADARPLTDAPSAFAAAVAMDTDTAVSDLDEVGVDPSGPEDTPDAQPIGAADTSVDAELEMSSPEAAASTGPTAGNSGQSAGGSAGVSIAGPAIAPAGASLGSAASASPDAAPSGLDVSALGTEPPLAGLPESPLDPDPILEPGALPPDASYGAAAVVRAVSDSAGTVAGQLVTQVPQNIAAPVETAVQSAVDLVAAVPTVVAVASTAVADTTGAVPTIVGQVATAIPNAAAAPGQALGAVQTAMPGIGGAVPTPRPTATPAPVKPPAVPTVAPTMPAVLPLPTVQPPAVLPKL